MKTPNVTLKDLTQEDLRDEYDRAIEKKDNRRIEAIKREMDRRDLIEI